MHTTLLTLFIEKHNEALAAKEKEEKLQQEIAARQLIKDCEEAATTASFILASLTGIAGFKPFGFYNGEITVEFKQVFYTESGITRIHAYEGRGRANEHLELEYCTPMTLRCKPLMRQFFLTENLVTLLAQRLKECHWFLGEKQ